MELIKNQNPIPPKKKLKSYIITYSISFLINIIFYSFYTTMFVHIIILLIIILSLYFHDKLKNGYDGWKITEDGILLMRDVFLKGKQSAFISNNELKKITIYQRGSAYKFETLENSEILSPPVSTFGFAPILRYYYEMGIELVYLGYSDHEVDLYVRGKIDSLPMTNDMEIKN